MNQGLPTWVEVSRTDQRKRSREHLLVLQAMGISHGQLEDENAFVLVVRPEDAERAREEIERYEHENAGWPPREETALAISDGVQAAIGYCAVLILFHALAHRGLYGLDWRHAGRVDAELVRQGEWWRCLTALSLHSDLTHLASNLLFGAAFGLILAQSVGSGVAWLGFALAGSIGNLVNAYAQAPQHTSVGASTGVFGALGIQLAYEWTRRKELRYGLFRRWVPVAMGFLLAAWIGMGGLFHDEMRTAKETADEIRGVLGKVDVMAHVSGLAAGIATGLLLGRFRRRIQLRGRKQAFLAWATLALLAGAWAAALLPRPG